VIYLIGDLMMKMRVKIVEQTQGNVWIQIRSDLKENFADDYSMFINYVYTGIWRKITDNNRFITNSHLIKMFE
jgi:hypothetical protein